MLYETAARAPEVRALDVEDLECPRPRARIRSNGASVDMIRWSAPTAHLLGRYLTDVLPVPSSSPGGAPPIRDLYQPTGQARLSYRTTAAEFRKHGGWTSTSCTTRPSPTWPRQEGSAVMLQAKSRHRDLRTLSIFTRPGIESVA